MKITGIARANAQIVTGMTRTGMARVAPFIHLLLLLALSSWFAAPALADIEIRPHDNLLKDRTIGVVRGEKQCFSMQKMHEQFKSNLDNYTGTKFKYKMSKWPGQMTKQLPRRPIADHLFTESDFDENYILQQDLNALKQAVQGSSELPSLTAKQAKSILSGGEYKIWSYFSAYYGAKYLTDTNPQYPTTGGIMPRSGSIRVPQSLMLGETSSYCLNFIKFFIQGHRMQAKGGCESFSLSSRKAMPVQSGFKAARLINGKSNAGSRKIWQRALACAGDPEKRAEITKQCKEAMVTCRPPK